MVLRLTVVRLRLEQANGRFNANELTLPAEALPLGLVVAGIHAWEAICILTGIPPPTITNREGEIDFVDMGISYHSAYRNQDCPVCGQN